MDPLAAEPNRRRPPAHCPRAVGFQRRLAGIRIIAMSMATLMWGVIFGAIGMGFFVYGKRQGAMIPLVCGIALMVFPYFVSNAWATVAVGGLLMAIPYFVRL